MLNSILTNKFFKVLVFVACLVPLGIILWRAYNHDLTANPIEFITHATGDWTIRFVVITLAITPVRKILRLPQLIRFRRMIGLYAFFYGFLHFSIWIGIDKFFDWSEMMKDVAKRPFITVGFTGFVLMIPLAITSTAGWIRRLGGRRWQLLHRLIYVTAIAGVIHYYWLVKSDVHKPLEYAWMVGALLAWRAITWAYERWQSPAAQKIKAQEPVTAETSGRT